MSARVVYGLIGIVYVIAFAVAWYGLHTNSTQRIETQKGTMRLSSDAFVNGGDIPPRYTCDGDNISPPLKFSDVPPQAVSLALVAVDPDVPKQLKPDGVFDHWVLFNIPADVEGIPEGESTGAPGSNGAGKNAYTGPCPPPQYEPKEHRYIFSLYALDTELPLEPGASKETVLKAMEGHVLEKAELEGRYARI